MEALLAHCFEAFSRHGSIFVIFFLGGLTGGFTHCISMCGPFVACDRLCASACPSSSRNAGLQQALNIPYHLGRFTMYGALGFLAALLSKQIASSPWWPVIAGMMLAIAGLLFIASFFKSCAHGHSASSPIGKLNYGKGLLLGFIPCGLLYGALMMAATLTNPLSGMFAMWLFTLGTLPALWIAGGGAELLNRKWRHALRNIGRAMLAFNGLSLLVMAARTMR